MKQNNFDDIFAGIFNPKSDIFTVPNATMEAWQEYKQVFKMLKDKFKDTKATLNLKGGETDTIEMTNVTHIEMFWLGYFMKSIEDKK